MAFFVFSFWQSELEDCVGVGYDILMSEMFQLYYCATGVSSCQQIFAQKGECEWKERSQSPLVVILLKIPF